MNLSDEERRERTAVVTDQYGGIVPMYEAFYIEALAYAAGRTREAFVRFDEASVDAADPANWAEIVAAVHEALSHVAALSRYFWPARLKPPHGPRAEKLRASFELDESSPLADRDLRNVLEHFDERLDTFLLQDMAGYFFPGPMVGDASLNDDALGHIFRLVDPNAEIFILLGEKYEFGPMRKAVDDILEKLDQTKGGRLK